MPEPSGGRWVSVGSGVLYILLRMKTALLFFFFFPHISISNTRDRVTDRKRSPHPRPWRFVNRSLPEPARPAGWCPVCLWLHPHLTAAVCVQDTPSTLCLHGAGVDGRLSVCWPS